MNLMCIHFLSPVFGQSVTALASWQIPFWAILNEPAAGTRGLNKHGTDPRKPRRVLSVLNPSPAVRMQPDEDLPRNVRLCAYPLIRPPQAGRAY